MMRHCTAYGCSNQRNKVGWENLLWHKRRSKHRFCYVARAGTTEHLNTLFFGKICVWSYVSPYYLLEFTTFAVDHDPNASLSCAFKLLNCRLKCNNCYCAARDISREHLAKDCGYQHKGLCLITNLIFLTKTGMLPCLFTSGLLTAAAK